MTTKDQGGKAAERQALNRRPPQIVQEEESLARQTQPAEALQRLTAGTEAPVRPQDIVALQQSVGNLAVQRLLAQREQTLRTQGYLAGTFNDDGAVQLAEGDEPAAAPAAGGETEKTEAEKTEEKLNENGITIHSSGGCRDKTKKNCTSVDGMREATVDGIIAFRNAAGVDLVMTGGTETGHASGTYSHANGYKVDIALNETVTKYIKDNFKSKGTRKDGAALYEDDDGNVFALESNHWDITFK